MSLWGPMGSELLAGIPGESGETSEDGWGDLCRTDNNKKGLA
ncbi:MAG: hypothetical protein N0E39_14550 [Candidatus Thiodiazotropha lotti]|nr:hypothetical protein [Candidatus Thiodiazotropha lotti]MCW4212361.1 hypothetical protein [Candidatus Thiodiazotropha lotti]MCW4217874.1 hypothetical protein [Candidatus Thiodiazotropha lotti]